MRSETPEGMAIWEERKALAIAMTQAAKAVPGKIPPQATMPVAVIIIAECVAAASPEARSVLGRMLLDLGAKLLGERP